MFNIDFGCGKTPREGFIGVDVRNFGQSIICDLSCPEWIFWAESKVEGFKSYNRQDALCKPKDVSQKEEWQPYLLEDNSVDEAHCSHFIEHLTSPERINFINELYRVLKPGAKATIIAPHWASSRSYGDLTHQWPPVSEFWFYYLLASWRETNAPHNDFYKCDFDATWGYAVHPTIAVRNQESQQFALQFYKEAAQDLIATIIKRPVDL